MQLIVIAPFDWAHQGVRIEHFPLNAEFETEDIDLIDVSTREKWTRSANSSGAAAELPALASELGPPDPSPPGTGEPVLETPPVVDPAPKAGRGRSKQ